MTFLFLHRIFAVESKPDSSVFYFLNFCPSFTRSTLPISEPVRVETVIELLKVKILILDYYSRYHAERKAFENIEMQTRNM